MAGPIVPEAETVELTLPMATVVVRFDDELALALPRTRNTAPVMPAAISTSRMRLSHQLV